MCVCERRLVYVFNKSNRLCNYLNYGYKEVKKLSLTNKYGYDIIESESEENYEQGI